jgi:hypothetical protein
MLIDHVVNSMTAKLAPTLGFVAFGISLWMPSFCLASSLSLIKSRDLDFGKMIGGGIGLSGTVTVDTTGRRVSSGGVRLLGNTFSPASFTLSGTPGVHYSIICPSSLTLYAQNARLNLTSITLSIPLTGVLPADGVVHFTMGGTLMVSGNEASSTYRSNLSLSVE